MAAKSSRKAKKKAKPARRTRAAATKSKTKRKATAVKKKPVRSKPRSAKANSKTKVRRAAKRPARKAAKTPKRQRVRATPAQPTRKPTGARMRPAERPTLDRTRRVLSDEERFGSVPGYPAQATESVVPSVAPGRHMQSEIDRHAEATAALTAGDPDARWQDAYAVGDEAPGGDNPTPDQDRVDEIGRALGIEYADDQELQGGEEVTKRDKHRWELDPASSEDWPHGDKE
jgi:hypothetical protein